MFQGHRKVALATGKEQEVERVFPDWQQALHLGTLPVFLGVDRCGLNAREKWTEVSSFSRGWPERDAPRPPM